MRGGGGGGYNLYILLIIPTLLTFLTTLLAHRLLTRVQLYVLLIDLCFFSIHVNDIIG